MAEHAKIPMSLVSFISIRPYESTDLHIFFHVVLLTLFYCHSLELLETIEDCCHGYQS